MSTLPKVSSYGNYSGDNYGVHCLVVDLEHIRIYYSYKTIIAYYDQKDGLVCSVNQWSITTGRHLNMIQPDKKARVRADQFDAMLKAALARHIME